MLHVAHPGRLRPSLESLAELGRPRGELAAPRGDEPGAEDGRTDMNTKSFQNINPYSNYYALVKGRFFVASHVRSSIFRPGLIAPWRRELTTSFSFSSPSITHHPDY